MTLRQMQAGAESILQLHGSTDNAAALDALQVITVSRAAIQACHAHAAQTLYARHVAWSAFIPAGRLAGLRQADSSRSRATLR